MVVLVVVEVLDVVSATHCPLSEWNPAVHSCVVVVAALEAEDDDPHPAPTSATRKTTARSPLTRDTLHPYR